MSKKKRLEVVAVDNIEDDTCRTFVMHEEDHTLGNSLRYVIMKNPDTEFCGYSVPHPSENKINFRIQSKGPSAQELLKKGLEDLSSVCDHVLDKFEQSVNEFKVNQAVGTDEPMES